MSPEGNEVDPVPADPEKAQRITGYQVGGISPFGTRQRMTTVIEESIARKSEILINAGQRGRMLRMHPKDVQSVLGCTVAAIAR